MEKWYKWITVSCGALCTLMLICMAAGKPITTQATVHIPPGRPAYSESGEKVTKEIGEEYFGSHIGGYLPEGFPVEVSGVSISADGTVSVSGSASRENIERYLEKCGMKLGFKNGLLFKFLPEELELCGTLGVSSAAGKIMIAPRTLRVNRTEVSLDTLPEELVDQISGSVDRLISDVCPSGAVSFRDGALIITTG